MAFEALNEADKQFLTRLYEETGGQPSRQVSMYAIGAALGWDRDAAARAAQDLMAAGFVDIRTLSGGIGISADGATALKSALGSRDQEAAGPRLGDSRIIDKTAGLAVEQVCDELRNQAGSMGLDFETLTELMADLKTIADQLGSSRPKTAIVREGLRSLAEILTHVPGNKNLDRIKALIGA
jgi:hypothetical protein